MRLPYTTEAGARRDGSKEAIVVVNDEQFSQDCLVQTIRSQFPDREVMGLAAIEQLEQLADIIVTLVLLRFDADRGSSSQLIADIKAAVHQAPRSPIVILSPSANADFVGEVMALGVRGIIPVATPLKIAIAALQLVLAGGIYCPLPLVADVPTSDAVKNGVALATQELGPPMGAQGSAGQANAALASDTIFTAREAQVLEALQKGWSNKGIAYSLHISENTIKVHIQRIMRKLHATNRTEAVVRHLQLQDPG